MNLPRSKTRSIGHPLRFPLVLVLLLGLLPRLDAESTVRVALMDFAVTERSYRAALSASEMTTLVQVLLSATAKEGLEFVERQELGRAEKELQLGGVGFGDRIDALRAGHWVRADWAVVGRIVTNGVASTRLLRLEVVDLHHAERLASTDLTLASASTTHYALVASDSERIAVALRGLMERELLRWRRWEKAVTLAWLPAPPSVGNPVEWSAAPAAQPIEVREVHFTRMGDPRLDDALELEGFTLASTNAVARLADFYGWSAQPPATFPGTWKAVLWDGVNVPRDVRIPVTGPDPEELHRELGRLLAVWKTEMANEAAPLDHRRFLAGEFASEVREQLTRGFTVVRSTNGLPTMGIREMSWIRTGLYLDPDDRYLRELWTRLRWNPVWAGREDGFLSLQRRRFEAWAGLLDRFGTTFVVHRLPAPALAPKPISVEFLDAAGAGLAATMANDAKSRQGVPDDVGGEVLARWHRHFIDGLVQRIPLLEADPRFQHRLPALLTLLIQDFEQTTPDREEALRRLPWVERVWNRASESPELRTNLPIQLSEYLISTFYRTAGKPERGEELVRELQRLRALREAPRVEVATFPRPRVSDLDEADVREFFSLGGVHFLPPPLAVRAVPYFAGTNRTRSNTTTTVSRPSSGAGWKLELGRLLKTGAGESKTETGIGWSPLPACPRPSRFWEQTQRIAGHSATDEEVFRVFETIARRAESGRPLGFTRLRHPIRCFLEEGERLWVACDDPFDTRGSVVAVYHIGRARWLGSIRAGGTVLRLRIEGEDVVADLGGEREDGQLGWRWNLAACRKLDPDRGVTDAVPLEEALRRGKGLPVSEFATLALFGGDPAKAKSLLDPLPPAARTALHWTLLALAQDVHGLADAAGHRRCVEALQREYPTSAYSQALRLEELRSRNVPSRTREATQRWTGLVADYDLDGDASLSGLELAVAVRTEPKHFPINSPFNSAVLHARNALMLGDRDRIPGFSAAELERWATGTLRPAPARPPTATNRLPARTPSQP
jgi:hypothetical protein